MNKQAYFKMMMYKEAADTTGSTRLLMSNGLTTQNADLKKPVTAKYNRDTNATLTTYTGKDGKKYTVITDKKHKLINRNNSSLVQKAPGIKADLRKPSSITYTGNKNKINKNSSYSLIYKRAGIWDAAGKVALGAGKGILGAGKKILNTGNISKNWKPGILSVKNGWKAWNKGKADLIPAQLLIGDTGLLKGKLLKNILSDTWKGGFGDLTKSVGRGAVQTAGALTPLTYIAGKSVGSAPIENLQKQITDQQGTINRYKNIANGYKSQLDGSGINSFSDWIKALFRLLGFTKS